MIQAIRISLVPTSNQSARNIRVIHQAYGEFLIGGAIIILAAPIWIGLLILVSVSIRICILLLLLRCPLVVGPRFALRSGEQLNICIRAPLLYRRACFRLVLAMRSGMETGEVGWGMTVPQVAALLAARCALRAAS